MHTRDRIRLGRKLAEDFHLSVAERQRLPGGKMPLSAIVMAVRQSLMVEPFFPPRLRPEAIGDGAIIEQRGKHHFRVHEAYEIRVQRFSPPSFRTKCLLRSAVIRYLKHYGPLQIDGVRIDRWK